MQFIVAVASSSLLILDVVIPVVSVVAVLALVVLGVCSSVDFKRSTNWNFQTMEQYRNHGMLQDHENHAWTITVGTILRCFSP